MKKSIIAIGVLCILLVACKDNKTTDNANETKTEVDSTSTAIQNSTTEENDKTEKEVTLDLAEVAMNTENLSSFVDAIEKAGMVVKIKGEGPFTIFAPTNEAFSKLPKETLENLKKPVNAEKLEAALSYHIIPGNVDAKKLKDLINNSENKKYELITANDGKIEASINSDKKVVLTDSKGSQATVVEVDKKGKNGVIHSINTVLMRK
ncbi:Uncaracterized surface protein containing fasciclin (FAS1) repeats [Mesonia phycicola]|uniref:Uncaracterized surface protein containing fasciclin (FAS1) repeats n=1 Tax=Mesonia phycicola TaxID=579105 RepID=A0A1M6F8U3_9FLAO|nr:fasciclin domain-containing protein [Mesonia phycicola]SHI94100.1 Uncaracterized surface protein containing fasciclin (FAS1) repeats [Mesonia phycicola]